MSDLSRKQQQTRRRINIRGGFLGEKEDHHPGGVYGLEQNRTNSREGSS